MLMQKILEGQQREIRYFWKKAYSPAQIWSLYRGFHITAQISSIATIVSKNRGDWDDADDYIKY